MYDFGNANEEQKLAISTSDGPVLIMAGPGTGKTFTLVQRAIFLIQECGVKPEQILMATFTEKAAKELVTRITNELSKRGDLYDVFLASMRSAIDDDFWNTRETCGNDLDIGEDDFNEAAELMLNRLIGLEDN